MGAHRLVYAARTGLGLVLLSALACGTSKPPVVNFSASSADYRAEDYQTVYERWMRHEKVTHNLESALEVWAVYKSLDFREAFVARYAEAYGLGEDDREHLRQSQLEAAGTSYEFVLTAQSANYRWNDLEKKNSPWRVSLLDGAEREITAEELRVEKFPDLFERQFYPAKTPFTKTYVVRFSRTTGKDDGFTGDRSGRVVLRFASPLGRADLVWSSQSQ